MEVYFHNILTLSFVVWRMSSRRASVYVDFNVPFELPLIMEQVSRMFAFLRLQKNPLSVTDNVNLGWSTVLTIQTGSEAQEFRPQS